VGKSWVMKHLAQRLQPEGCIIVLRNGRVISGGWVRMGHELGCTVSQDELFNELGCGGGATLFIDNIDQIDDARDWATVTDLLAAVSRNPGWRAVVTGRIGNDEWKLKLPVNLRGKNLTMLEVKEIRNDEAVFRHDVFWQMLPLWVRTIIHVPLRWVIPSLALVASLSLGQKIVPILIGQTPNVQSGNDSNDALCWRNIDVRCVDRKDFAVKGVNGTPSAIEFSPRCKDLLEYRDQYTLKVRHKGATVANFSYHSNYEWQNGLTHDLPAEPVTIDGDYASAQVHIPRTSHDDVYWYVRLANDHGATCSYHMKFSVEGAPP
jgi:hypothetical protein